MLREPKSLPDLFDDWQEWRLRYAEFKQLYVSGQLSRHELRQALGMMGYRGSDLESELDDLLEQRRETK